MFEFFKQHKFLTVLLVSLALSFVLFGNSIQGDFVFDDNAVVKNRGDLKDISNIFNLFISPYHQNMPKTGLYRPFTMATYALNHALFGTEPKNFHVTNIIIHAINSFLVFWFVLYFLKSEKLAYLSFLLFLTHPLHTEAVTWIVGRAELLALLWSMVAIYFFVKKDKLLTSIAFLLGLWSKESALATVPILVYIDYNFNETPLLRSFINISYLVGSLGVYSLFRYWALGKYFFGDVTTTIVENQIKFLDFGSRIATALKVFTMYLVRLVWPVHLSADYSFNTISSITNIFTSLETIIGLITLVGLIYVLINKTIRNSVIGLGVVIFLMPYLMISNLFFQVGTIMGERLMYFSSLGFVLIVASGIYKLVESGDKKVKYLGYAVLITILCLFSFRTIVRNRDWHDMSSLFYATLKESPNSLVVRTALAGIDIRQNNWKDAKKELEIAERIYADNSHLQNLLGTVSDHNGNYGEAEKRYKKSIILNADAIDAYINLGELLVKQGRFQEASGNFKRVIDFYPLPEYVIRYAYIQISLNQPDTALEIMGKYYGANLSHPDLSVVVGTAYFVKREYDQALAYLLNAQKLGNNSQQVQQMIALSKSQLSPKK